MKVLGLSSGTSLDGIDALVAAFQLTDDTLTVGILGRSITPYSEPLRTQLLAMLPPGTLSMREVAQVDTLIGQEFAAAASALVRSTGPVDGVCSHGQTVYHWVDANGQARGTLQLGQAAWIAEALGAPVVSDVRSRDIAAGGQGAPLVALLDELLLAGQPGSNVALNIGGISNVTVVSPGSPTRAYDVGPGNALIDAVVQDRDLHPDGYDADGQIAQTGRVNDTLLRSLLTDPYYASPPPKSTGKEHFHLAYLREHLADLDVSAPDLVRTLTELTARTLADDLGRLDAPTVWASGGGVHNPVLMDRLRTLAPHARVRPTSELGIAEDDKEALLFALLGWYHLSAVPASIPSATGARGARILGSVTPGNEPWNYPSTPTAPRALRIETRHPGSPS